MVLVLGVGGMQMLMLGIVAEYVWRTRDQVRGAPLYIIAEEYGQNDETGGRSPVTPEKTARKRTASGTDDRYA